MPTGHKLTQEQIDYVCENFANKTNYELVAETGLARSTICRMQRRYNLHKSAEHIHNMGVKAGKASDKARGGVIVNANSPEAIAKRAATYKKLRDSELIRYKWGLEQKTKIRLPKVCRRAKDQRLNLIRRGYIIDDVNKIAYWTSETRRATRLERLKRGDTSTYFRTYYDFKPHDDR